MLIIAESIMKDCNEQRALYVTAAVTAAVTTASQITEQPVQPVQPVQPEDIKKADQPQSVQSNTQQQLHLPDPFGNMIIVVPKKTIAAEIKESLPGHDVTDTIVTLPVTEVANDYIKSYSQDKLLEHLKKIKKPDQSKAIRADFNKLIPGGIIQLPSEIYFHLSHAANVAMQVACGTPTEEAEEVAEKFQHALALTYAQMNEQFFQVYAECLATAYDAVYEESVKLDRDQFRAALNQNLAKHRVKLAEQGVVQLRVNIIKATGLVFTHEQINQMIKLSPKLPATANNVINVDANSATCTLGTAHTSHNKQIGGDKIGDMEQYSCNKNNKNNKNKYDAARTDNIRIPSLVIQSTKRITQQQVINDVKAKIEYLVNKHNLGEAKTGCNINACHYHLLTSISDNSITGILDEGKNHQRKNLKAILQGAHLYNREVVDKIPKQSLFLVNNVPVNGFGYPLTLDSSNPDIVNEAYLMAVMSQWHMCWESMDEKTQKLVNEIFKDYKEFLQENASPKFFYNYLIENGIKIHEKIKDIKDFIPTLERQLPADSVDEPENKIDLDEQSEPTLERQLPAAPDDQSENEIDSDAQSDIDNKNEKLLVNRNLDEKEKTIILQRLLLFFFKDDSLSNLHYGLTIQAIATSLSALNGGDLYGCKSGNERTGAVNGRAAIIYLCLQSDEYINEKIQYLDEDVRNEYLRLLQNVKKCLLDDSLDGLGIEQLTQHLNEAYDKIKLEDLNITIHSRMDQAARSKLGSSYTKGIIRSTNNSDQVSSGALATTGTSDTQSHKGGAKIIGKAWEGGSKRVKAANVFKGMALAGVGGAGAGAAVAAILLLSALAVPPLIIPIGIGALVGMGLMGGIYLTKYVYNKYAAHMAQKENHRLITEHSQVELQNPNQQGASMINQLQNGDIPRNCQHSKVCVPHYHTTSKQSATSNIIDNNLKQSTTSESIADKSFRL